MKFTQNTVTVAGYIYSFGEANGRNNLEVKVTGDNSKNPGTEYIAGTIQVAVDEAGLNVIPVHFTYVTEKTSTGKTSPTFGVLKSLIDSGKTWVANGKENATKVKIDTALALNDFFIEENGTDRLVSSVVHEGGFVNVINGELYGSQLTLSVAIRNMRKHTGASVCDLIKMVTSTPAKTVGLYRDRGSIEPGKIADLVVLDEDLRVKGVLLEGKFVRKDF